MKKIIIFSGTTEGRKLSELMAAAGIAHTVSVATDYGKLVMKAHPKVNQGKAGGRSFKTHAEAGDGNDYRCQQ